MPPTNEPDDKGAAGTGAAPQTPPATQQPQAPSAATPQLPQLPEGYEAIRTEDKNKLISQRDKAKSGADQETQGIVNALVQKDAVRDAMADPKFKENYPDVSFQELLDANPMSDDDITEIAKTRQARYEEVKQAHVSKVQRAETPTISAADKAAREAELRKPAKKSRFQDAVKLALTQVKN